MSEARAVKFCIQLDYIKCLQKDDKSSLTWSCLRSCDTFKFSVPPNVSLEWLKLQRLLILYTGPPCNSLALGLQIVP